MVSPLQNGVLASRDRHKGGFGRELRGHRQAGLFFVFFLHPMTASAINVAQTSAVMIIACIAPILPIFVEIFLALFG